MLRGTDGLRSSDFSVGGGGEIGTKGILPMNVSRATAKKMKFYNYSCKPVLLSVQFAQPLAALDLQREEGRRRLWPSRSTGSFWACWGTRSSKRALAEHFFGVIEGREVKSAAAT
jgi:hypothetical protein